MTDEIRKKYEARVKDLLTKLTRVTSDQPSMLYECYSGTVNLFEAIYGSESLQVQEVIGLVKQFRDINPYPGVMDERITAVLKGQLENALSELQGDIIEQLFSKAAGQAIGDFVLLAQLALDDSQKDVAAVLAAAALEDALKTKAGHLGIDVEGRELSDVVNALKAKSFFQGAQHKVVSSFVLLRNKAMHAEWDRIARPEVESLVAFVKSFALEHF